MKSNMMESLATKRYNTFRKLLVFWCLFIGIGAMAGGICMEIKPDGSILHMQSLIPYFQVLPFASVIFQDYVFSGIALIIVNGLTNLTAAWLLIKKRKSGIICGLVFGVTLMLWIVIQFIIFPPNFLDEIYFTFGILQALTGFACWVFYRQAQWADDPKAYTSIGSNPDTLVVYFSRLGRVRRIALEEAQRTGGKLFEVTTPERTEGTLGFWWCGRFGMHNWPMKINAMPEDLQHYDKVIICSSLWVFRICAPIRQFCMLAKGQISDYEYVLVHFNPWLSNGAATELETLIGKKPSRRTSISAPLGYYRKRRVF